MGAVVQSNPPCLDVLEEMTYEERQPEYLTLQTPKHCYRPFLYLPLPIFTMSCTALLSPLLGSSTCSKLIPDYLNPSQDRQRAISTAVLLLLLPGLELMLLSHGTVKILTFQLIKPNSMKATTSNFKKIHQ